MEEKTDLLKTYARNPFPLLQTEMDINTAINTNALGNPSMEDLNKIVSVNLHVFELYVLRTVLGHVISDLEGHLGKPVDIADFL